MKPEIEVFEFVDNIEELEQEKILKVQVVAENCDGADVRLAFVTGGGEQFPFAYVTPQGTLVLTAECLGELRRKVPGLKLDPGGYLRIERI